MARQAHWNFQMLACPKTCCSRCFCKICTGNGQYKNFSTGTQANANYMCSTGMDSLAGHIWTDNKVKDFCKILQQFRGMTEDFPTHSSHLCSCIWAKMNLKSMSYVKEGEGEWEWGEKKLAKMSHQLPLSLILSYHEEALKMGGKKTTKM